MSKLGYRAAGMLASVAGGIVAGAIFNKAWKITAGEEEAPSATDAERGRREILLAARLQGAIFGVPRNPP